MRLVCLTMGLAVGLCGFSQKKVEYLLHQDSIDLLAQKQTKTARSGALVLSTWSLTNMVVGGIGRSTTVGETRYFHEMNLYWNSVNLVLGGLGYLATLKPASTNYETLLKSHHLVEKIYLFNTALDLAYIASGWALYNKGLSTTGLKAERNKGYGTSLYLQGGFLFVYDLLLFSAHQKNRKKLEGTKKNLEVSLTPIGFRMCYTFSENTRRIGN